MSIFSRRKIEKLLEKSIHVILTLIYLPLVVIGVVLIATKDWPLLEAVGAGDWVDNFIGKAHGFQWTTKNSLYFMLSFIITMSLWGLIVYLVKSIIF